MKFFSNFDTNLDSQLYQDNINKYGKDHVMIIYKDKIFFFFTILLPLLLAIFLLLLTILIGFIVDAGEFQYIVWGIIGIAVLIGFITVSFKLLKHYIDYKMDFTIVTPDIIVSYNQTGFFSRDSRSIRASKIKTISINKKGLIKSFFNFGTIIFLSEGDDSGKGDITLFYVQDPDKIRQRIKEIIYTEENKKDND